MAIDFEALKARLAAQKVVTTKVDNVETTNTNTQVVPSTSVPTVPSSDADIHTLVCLNTPSVLGTAKTSELDHLDFLAKMNSLQEAIHKQHPTMPVLLMQIHKQLRADPELVTTLDEDAIGVIVKGLQIQTKTELVSKVMKETKAGRKKATAISVDML